MVYLVGGFLFNVKTIHAWGTAHNVDLPKSVIHLSCALDDWFAKEGWGAFWPLTLTWPRGPKVTKGKGRGAKGKGAPKVVLVCHDKDVIDATVKRYPRLEKDEVDQKIKRWLKQQGFTRIRWITVPDPYQNECSDLEDRDVETWEDDDDWDTVSKEDTIRQRAPANKTNAPKDTSSSRARASDGEPQASTSTNEEKSPGPSNENGRTLRSGRTLLSLARNDIASPTSRTAQKGKRSLRPRRGS